MKITVLYNLVTSKAFGGSKDLLAEDDTVKTAKAIALNLKKNHDVTLFEVREDNVKDLKNLRPDLFFNNAFGIGSIPKSEADLAALLEKTKIPFTGSGFRAIVLTTDKLATKEVLEAGNLPTPKTYTLGINLKFPLIVKPVAEDSSLGITDRSVVKNEKELILETERIKNMYDEEALIEEYIDGRELNVTVLGNGDNATPLPISEIVFGPLFNDKYKIVDFTAKWEEDTQRYKETTGVCPADLPKKVTEQVQELALTAFVATGCNDVARVDIRLDQNDRPFILEVNANPGIGPTDGATRSAKAAGLTYGQFLEKIVQMAISR